MKLTKKWVSIVIGMLIIVATGVYFFLQWANTPSKQTLSINKSTAPYEVPTTKSVETQYYTTSVPFDFRVQIKEKVTADGIDQLSAFSTKGTGIQIGITTGVMPSEGISGVADYLYRIKNTSAFEQLSNEKNDTSIITFRKIIENGEMTQFFVNGSRYASITVSSQTTGDVLIDTTFDLVTKEWKWR